MGIIISLAAITCVLAFLAFADSKWWYTEWAFMVSVVFAILFGISVICCSTAGFVIHQSAEATLYELEQERESLVDSYNTYRNEYEDDLAHFDSTQSIRCSIADFNAKIYRNNYYKNNFWVNCFYVDCNSIEPISINNGVAE